MSTAADPFGVLVVDKPAGLTSHDVVQRVRRAGGLRKVGHTGTLDPQATGVLVLCLGEATRLSEYMTRSSKAYEAVVRFGVTTDSYDASGRIVNQSGESPEQDQVVAALSEFEGPIEQVPPPYSAIKVDGERAYRLARKGRKPQLEARTVTIHEIEMLDYLAPDLRLRIVCSAGTYVRSLAYDLGRVLGVGAHLAELRRLAVGQLTLSQAIPLAELEEALRQGDWQQHLIAPVKALAAMPVVTVPPEGQVDLRHGRPILPPSRAVGTALGVDGDGKLLAVLEAADDGKLWRPRKVFSSES